MGEGRTRGGLGRPPDWEPCVAQLPTEPALTHSPCHPTGDLTPGTPGHRAESWSPRLESPRLRPTLQPPPPHRWTAAVPWAAWPRLLLASPARRRNLSGEPRTSQGSPALGSGGRAPPTPARGPGAPEHSLSLTTSSIWFLVFGNRHFQPTSSSHLAIMGSVSHLLIFPSLASAPVCLIFPPRMQLPVPFSMTFCCLKRANNTPHTRH